MIHVANPTSYYVIQEHLHNSFTSFYNKVFHFVKIYVHSTSIYIKLSFSIIMSQEYHTRQANINIKQSSISHTLYSSQSIQNLSLKSAFTQHTFIKESSHTLCCHCCPNKCNIKFEMEHIE